MLWSLLPSGAAIVPNRFRNRRLLVTSLEPCLLCFKKHTQKWEKGEKKEKKKKKRVLGFDEKLIGNEKKRLFCVDLSRKSNL